MSRLDFYATDSEDEPLDETALLEVNIPEIAHVDSPHSRNLLNPPSDARDDGQEAATSSSSSTLRQADHEGDGKEGGGDHDGPTLLPRQSQARKRHSALRNRIPNLLHSPGHQRRIPAGMTKVAAGALLSGTTYLENPFDTSVMPEIPPSFADPEDEHEEYSRYLIFLKRKSERDHRESERQHEEHHRITPTLNIFTDDSPLPGEEPDKGGHPAVSPFAEAGALTFLDPSQSWPQLSNLTMLLLSVWWFGRAAVQTSLNVYFVQVQIYMLVGDGLKELVYASVAISSALAAI